MNKLQIIAGTDMDEAPVRVDLATNPKGPDDPFWLNNYDIGTVFLAREKNSRNPFLIGFCIRTKTDKSVHLLLGDKTEKWVDPRDFSRSFDLHEVILSSEEFKEVLKEQANERKDTD